MDCGEREKKSRERFLDAIGRLNTDLIISVTLIRKRQIQIKQRFTLNRFASDRRLFNYNLLIFIFNYQIHFNE